MAIFSMPTYWLRGSNGRGNIPQRWRHSIFSTIAIMLVLALGGGCNRNDSADTPAATDTPTTPAPPAAPADTPTVPARQSRPTVDLSPDLHITEDTRIVAESLNNDPLRIFDYVRNNFVFEPSYFGSLKGSQETLLQRSGNDVDQASVLIALLRAANIPARYVSATVTVPMADALPWIGVENASAVQQVLAAAGVQASVTNEGALRLPHVWVEAQLPNASATQQWTALDPSFKQHSFAQARNLAQEAGLSQQELATAFQESTVTSSNGSQMTLAPDAELAQSILRKRAETIRSFVQNTMPKLTVQDVIGGRSVIAVPLTALPTTLPYAVTEPAVRFDRIPDAERHYVRVFFQGINTDLAIPEVASKRLTLSFVPDTPAGQAAVDAAGGLLYKAPASVDLKPQLKIDGAVRAEGFKLGLASSLANNLQLTFHRGIAFESETVSHGNLTVGGHYAIVLDTQRASAVKIRRAAARLKAALAASGTAQGDAVLSDDVTGELLYLLGLYFFGAQDLLSEQTASFSNAVAVQAVNEALLRLDLHPSGQQVRLDGPTIDNQRNVFHFFSRKGDPAFNAESQLLAFGLASSNLEEKLFQEVLGLPAVSTTAVFREASNQGIPIMVLTKDNITAQLPKISASPFVKGSISVAVGEGRKVFIPQRSLDLYAWSGTGWLEFPFRKSGLGTLISGDLGGGQSIVCLQKQAAGGGLACPKPGEVVTVQILNFIKETKIRPDLATSIFNIFYSTYNLDPILDGPLGDQTCAVYGGCTSLDIPDGLLSFDAAPATGASTGPAVEVLVTRAHYPQDTAATTNFAPAVQTTVQNPVALAAGVIVKGISPQRLAEITAQHGASSTTEGVGKFGAQANIEALIRDTLRFPTAMSATYSGFIYARNFAADIGFDQQGKPTNRMWVIVNAAGEVVTAFPVPRT